MQNAELRRCIQAIFPLICLAVVGPLSLGCIDDVAPPKTSLMRETTAGRNRTGVSASRMEPFVIEWDATDLANLEGRIKRDVILVRWDGGEDLELLWGCRDPSVGGRFGAYGPPAWANGAVQQVDLSTRTALQAAVPMSAATLEGRLEKGESLALAYFAGSTREATRDHVSRRDLAGLRSCKPATHFVWRITLGAFELRAAAAEGASARGALGNAGAGLTRSGSSSVVQRGGELASCATEARERCQVPLRLSLRPIGDGDDEPVPKSERSATSMSASDILKKAIEEDPSLQAADRVQQAERALKSGDPGRCLELLREAEQLDGDVRQEQLELRGHCEMRAGHCDAGKQLVIQGRILASKRVAEDDPDRHAIDPNNALFRQMVDRDAERHGCLLESTKTSMACATEAKELTAEIDSALSPATYAALTKLSPKANVMTPPSPRQIEECRAATRKAEAFLESHRNAGCPRSAMEPIENAAARGRACTTLAGRCDEIERRCQQPATSDPLARAASFGCLRNELVPCYAEQGNCAAARLAYERFMNPTHSPVMTPKIIDPMFERDVPKCAPKASAKACAAAAECCRRAGLGDGCEALLGRAGAECTASLDGYRKMAAQHGARCE